MNIKTFFNVYVLMLIICLFFVPDAYSQSTPYAGEWKGDTWCTNPPEKKKQFRFDIWVENNVIKAKDYSAQNKFKPCIISNDGNLHCPWYRSNSDAHGTYVFYIDKNDPNLMRGHENTQNIKCKQYGYELRR